MRRVVAVLTLLWMIVVMFVAGWVLTGYPRESGLYALGLFLSLLGVVTSLVLASGIVVWALVEIIFGSEDAK